ncbi:MAG: hypothetical protein DRN25_03285 [Thermoplasmata archaeon]|nr:MAG: hypothetical protein DRN25_03285 [Thermoplasmata archaeon]
MNVISFLVITLLGISIIALSFTVFEHAKASHSQIAAKESLKDITSYIANVVVDAFEQANKSKKVSDSEPVINVSILLPKKVGGKRYFVEFGGRYFSIGAEATFRGSRSLGIGSVFAGVDKVVASTEDGKISAYSPLPYPLVGGGIIDSITPQHYIAIFRPASSEIEAVASYRGNEYSNYTTLILMY